MLTAERTVITLRTTWGFIRQETMRISWPSVVAKDPFAADAENAAAWKRTLCPAKPCGTENDMKNPEPGRTMGSAPVTPSTRMIAPGTETWTMGRPGGLPGGAPVGKNWAANTNGAPTNVA
jgi:hypothetical protein